jgi:hypothetical protein
MDVLCASNDILMTLYNNNVKFGRFDINREGHAIARVAQECRNLIYALGSFLLQILDALMQLLSRRPPPCAEALWHAGWLLRQFLPFNGHTLGLAGVSLLDVSSFARVCLSYCRLYL